MVYPENWWFPSKIEHLGNHHKPLTNLWLGNHHWLGKLCWSPMDHRTLINPSDRRTMMMTIGTTGMKMKMRWERRCGRSADLLVIWMWLRVFLVVFELKGSGNFSQLTMWMNYVCMTSTTLLVDPDNYHQLLTAGDESHQMWGLTSLDPPWVPGQLWLMLVASMASWNSPVEPMHRFGNYSSSFPGTRHSELVKMQAMVARNPLVYRGCGQLRWCDSFRIGEHWSPE